MKKGKVLIGIGIVLIIAAMGLWGYNIYTDMSAEKTVQEALVEINNMYENSEPFYEESTDIPYYVLNPKVEMGSVKVGDYEYIGVLTVPSFSLELPIISDWSYPALKVSPCRFSGSVYEDDMILAGHNYNSHFKKIRELQVGDKVEFRDIDMNTFEYAVVEKETLSDVDLEKLEGGDWDLSLFTCVASGSARMVIRCEKIN